MVFSAAIITATNTGVPLQRDDQESFKLKQYPGTDVKYASDAALSEKLNDKHDVWTYATNGASFIALGGLLGGLQEAFYTFEAMPDSASKSILRQANKVLGIVGRKTLLGAAMGFTFCYVEATVENMRGKHDMISGMAGGAAAGFLFSMIPPKPLPQPIAWPLAFAAAAALTDIVTEKIPEGMKDYRHWGPVRGREGWGDPEPPRPPILETSNTVRPVLGNFWRSQTYNNEEAPKH